MNVEDLNFPVCVSVGSVDFHMSSYLDLQIGDILILDQKVEDPVKVKAGGDVYFFARPGLQETHKAVKIYERVHNG